MRSLLVAVTPVIALLVVACSSGTKKPAIENEVAADVSSDAVSADGISPDSPQPDGKLLDTDLEPVDVDPWADIEICQPQCTGKQCGPNGCGTVCGYCDEGKICNDDGLCISEPGKPCAKLEECYPQACDLALGVCAPCSDDAQCAPAGEVCDEATGMCAECGTDADCMEGFGCQDHECKQLPCPAFPCPAGSTCDEATGTCIECKSDDDCAPNHHCVNAVCVPPEECESSKDCALDEVCDKVLLLCVECTIDADCPEGHRCTDNVCELILLCASDKDCKEYGKVCDKSVGECVDCLSDLDCALTSWCQGIHCVADICDQAAVWPACLDGDVVSCSQNGNQITLVTDCIEGQFCEAAECKPWVCAPDAPGCDGNSAFVCNADGSGYLQFVECGEKKGCSGGVCKDIVCEPSKLVCLDELSLLDCAEDGTSFEVTPCLPGTFCDAVTASCVPWVCSPDLPSCNGMQVVTCNPFGSAWIDGADCAAANQVCLAGKCVDCDPACGDKTCGPDACGGVCGTCGMQQACFAGYCIDTACSGECVGKTNAAFQCAADFCFPGLVSSVTVQAPLGDAVAEMWEAASMYGTAGTALVPKGGSSLVYLVTGHPYAEDHNDQMPPSNCTGDPFTSSSACDVVQADVEITAPPGALGFSVDFVFLSREWTVQQQVYNDRFYMVLTAPTTTGGAPQVVNYVECVNPGKYTAFVKDGKAWCYIGALADLQEPVNAPTTPITGTSFATSTGWMRTSWPIAAGEKFKLRFHVQDTTDAKFDSAIVVDNFQWITSAFTPGTKKL
ncbi:MAG: hypothetical protein FJ109_15600 [Deltaproteobacteria bacterium]|nr:hypothetical protein [Deltaproteobacteria bacterium]